ncbi:hypothetical protein KDW_31420 [Dictyobacter vulcani]|uniref:DUF3893 domain-containing protein n=2 Tax=Dictyobacter vulcani TaxID=2607529 RepID=A0A5J4KRB2_9CHLR|nr:hypothetical protein KDW_31420 [Dictyobacter vulcani]
MHKKEFIQPVACTIEAKSFLRNLSLVKMSFPEEWLDLLSMLQAEKTDRLNKPNTIPIRSLNAALATFLPYLIGAPNAIRKKIEFAIDEDIDSRQREQPSWLLAYKELDVEKLWFLTRAWLNETYRGCESLETVDGLLRLQDLQWQSTTIPLVKGVCDNGTADVSPLAYKVLPAYIADMLVNSCVCIPVGLEEKRLLRIPVETGAQLMTWPPAYFIDKKHRKHGYSYTIDITLQTTPGIPEPRVLFHYGVRRWHCESCLEDGKLYLKHQTSVYLHQSKALLDMAQTKTFTVATIEAIRVEGNTPRIPAWTNHLPQIAKRFGVIIPNAQELTQHPMKWLAGHEGIEIGIVCRNTRYHPIGTGIGPDVQEIITQQIMGILAPQISLLKPFKSFPIPRKIEAHPMMGDLRDIAIHDRLAALEKSVGPKVVIEVRWQKEIVRDMLVDRIIALLTGPRPPLIETSEQSNHADLMQLEDGAIHEDDLTNSEWSYEEDTNQENKSKRKPARKRAKDPLPQQALEQKSLPLPDGGELVIVTIPLDSIGSPLPAPDKKNKQTIHTHTNDRAAKIFRELEPASYPTLVLVELPNYKHPDLRRQFGQRDPKNALRLGMARTGRLTQFITSDASDLDKLRSRSESAVKDGLRQLGYIPFPINFSIPNVAIPDPLLVLGIWFIRITKRRSAVGVHLPVIVLMHTMQHKIFVWLPHDGQIRPYHQALLEITQLNPEQVKKRKRQDALNQVRQFLLNESARQGVENVVAFAVAQNARSTWPGLYNTEAAFDALRFEKGERLFSAKSLPINFRLIRLRTNQRNETPEWYIPGAKPTTTTQGLWVEGDANKQANRLFYSIASKPHTAAKFMVGKQLKPGENYRIPSIVEIIPLILHENDDAATWAIAVDQWRKMGYLTSDMTLFPLPLEFAKKMDEYAAVIGPWIFPEEWKGDEDENEDENEDETRVISE